VDKKLKHIATVSRKGWVVIPKALRDSHGFRPGTRVAFVEYGGMLALVPLPEQPIETMHGLLAEGPSLTEDLLAAHREEQAHGESFGEEG